MLLRVVLRIQQAWPNSFDENEFSEKRLRLGLGRSPLKRKLTAVQQGARARAVHDKRSAKCGAQLNIVQAL
ncbi:hypothetical protein [Bradyrhizobium sp. DOA9]|uniref:hypothetical protein n=1 Tax=Bradyrhizobium sp. DOA9 TaxID=1126627 RepID=UPI00178CFB46|nr:hypothetical protein [Bradyrhizobium sp. DOA9]